MAEYIEREALMNEIYRIGGHNLCEWETIGVKALVERQPSSDVVEDRHGKWEQIDDDVFCSECGKGWNVIDNCTETFDFCPKCGAKMDGKEKDNAD